MDYDGKIFKSVTNSENGEVDESTIFHYHQNGNIIWAEYAGSKIEKGHLIGKVGAEGNLEFSYHHINHKGEIKTGLCNSGPFNTPSGKLRLKEVWRWTCDDFSEGESYIEEM